MAGGSKKGERRGNANPNHVRKSAAPAAPHSEIAKAKRKAGRPLGSKNKTKSVVVPYIVKLLNQRSPAKIEKDLEIYYTVTGKRLRMPKEVLLDAMRYFENSAVEYAAVLQANLETAANAPPELRETLLEAVNEAEGKVDKYVSMAADVAFKAAPFIHPKLAAVLTGGDSKDNQTLLQLLMQDLDEAGRPPRFIEHGDS